MTVTLAYGPDRFRVLVALRDRTPQAYLTAGPLAVMHPGEESIDTPTREPAVRLLTRRLADRSIEALVDRSAVACETRRPP